jgi:D-alanyl-D-alanine carboxypeptidase/D-alanyl-D-alanine-endopeptidase (penicillin-binding protein 4)
MRNSSARFRSLIAVLAVFALLGAACSSDDGDDGASGDDGESADAGDRLTPQVGTLPPDAIDIMSQEHYAAARWSARVVNLETGDEELSLWVDDLMIMGSNMKLYTIGTALDVLGADDQITTPVHQVGDDLVLVGMGDPVMGGREATKDGPLGYSLPPQFDANGLPGAKPAPGNPVGGLEDLAEQVVASGVTSVPGDVLVDTRLFEDWTPTESTVSPIVVNDNLLGVVTTPGAAGEAPTFETVPETAAFELVNEVITVPDDEGTDIEFEEGEGNQLIVSGTVEEGSEPVLNVYHVPDPATFARTLFIEALQRAGVTVTADPTSLNDSEALPPQDAITDENLVGSIESPTFQAIAELVLKISHNEVANLTVCLMAVEAGSTECPDGFDPIRERTEALDITPVETWFVDGAGGGDASTTAGAITEWISWINDQPYGADFPQMLPILGEDGSIGMLGQDSPARGKIQAKTGTTAAVDASNGRLLMLGKALAGYMQSDDGTPYYFALYMNNGSFDGLQDQFTVNEELGDVAIALQQAL